jgi:hypothetical protein
MKINRLFLISICTLAIGWSSLGQSGIEKKIIATLGPGETLAYGENCFLLGQDPEIISFVTVVGSGSAKQYYCYGKDGAKTGPVKSPDPKYWADCKDKKAEDCIPNDDQNMTGMEKYIDWTDGSINFQGKKIGPYGQVLYFNISKNEQSVYAIALSPEQKLIYFDNTGRKLEINGSPEQIIVSPDGKRSFVKVNGSLNPFDPASLQKMIDNPEESNNPKVFLVSIDGTKLGPYPSSSYHDAWFTDEGRWIIYNDADISVDGKVLFKTSSYISPCDLWINSSGTDYAWANYEKLTFKDGAIFTAPLEVKYSTSGGKGYLRWVSLEDGKNIVFYKKPF